MIRLNFSVCNPWGADFKSLWNKSGSTFFKHKYWEVQVIKSNIWFCFEFSFTACQDHAGVNLELGLLGHEVHFTFYDNRHWDHTLNCWETHK